MGSKKQIHKDKLEVQEVKQKELEEAYKDLDRFILNMVIEKKLTLLPLYFDNALEGRRTYKGEFRFVASNEADLKQAPEALKKLGEKEKKKLLEII